MNARILSPFLIILSLVPVIVLNASLSGTLSFWPFQIVNALLGIFCVARIFPLNKKCQITADSVTYIFIYIFLVVAPLYQYSERATFWGGRSLSPQSYFYVSAVLLLAVIVYAFSYNLIYKRQLTQKKRTLPPTKLRNKNIPLFLSILSTLITIFAFRNSPELLFFRQFEDASIGEEFSNSSVSLLYGLFIRPMPVIIAALYNFIINKFDWRCIVLILLALISNFPLALARFYVAGVYIPLIFSIWKHLINKPIAFRLLLLFGILYVFPFLNQGRTVESTDEITFSLAPNYEMFLEGHFDTFQNGARIIVNDLTTYGYQLLGCIFFWFPRQWWLTKPIGSGGVIAHHFHLNFDHIAVNYWAEGWINFGLIGVILFSIALAYINAKVDFNFWHCKKSVLYKYRYLLYLGMIIFILRGDMISSVAYIVGLIASSYICYNSFIKTVKR